MWSASENCVQCPKSEKFPKKTSSATNDFVCIVSLKCRANVVTCFSERKIVGLTVWEQTKLKDESSILLVIPGRHLVAKGWVGRSATATWVVCDCVEREVLWCRWVVGCKWEMLQPPALLFGHVRVGNAYFVFTNKRSCTFRRRARASFVYCDFIPVVGGMWGWLLTTVVYGEVVENVLRLGGL